VFFEYKIKRLSSILLATSLMLMVIFCEKPVARQGYRIVSLSPAMTEIVFALGGQNMLVGVTTYCDYPEAAKKITKVGDFSNPSLERIVGLNPDLVIVNLPEQMRIKQALEKLKINIFVSMPKSLDDIYREIADIGRLINRDKNADSIVGLLQRTIIPVNNTRKRVYIEISPRPLVTIGSSTFLNQLIEMAGGENIFSELDKDYPVVSQEEIIARDPEVIIVLHRESIAGRLGWKKITAVKNNKVYLDLNPDYLMRPGPRIVLGYDELKEILE